MGYQELSLITNIVFLIFSVYLFAHARLDEKWIYASFSVGWTAGIIFYTRIIFFGSSSHDFSVMLRLFQNMSFGTWLVITSFEKLYSSHEGERIASESKEKVKTWLTRLTKS